MEIAMALFDKYGVQALGWAVAIFLAWKFVSKWDGNISKLTENVTELTSIVKVQQEQLDNIKEDVGTLQSHVFQVNYKKAK